MGYHFPLQGIFLNPGIEPTSPQSPALAGRLFTTEPPPRKPNDISSHLFVVIICIWRGEIKWLVLMEMSQNFFWHVHTAVFIYFWLCWVFIAAQGLSLVAVSEATLH